MCKAGTHNTDYRRVASPRDSLTARARSTGYQLRRRVIYGVRSARRVGPGSSVEPGSGSVPSLCATSCSIHQSIEHPRTPQRHRKNFFCSLSFFFYLFDFTSSFPRGGLVPGTLFLWEHSPCTYSILSPSNLSRLRLEPAWQRLQVYGPGSIPGGSSVPLPDALRRHQAR